MTKQHEELSKLVSVDLDAGMIFSGHKSGTINRIGMMTKPEIFTPDSANYLTGKEYTKKR